MKEGTKNICQTRGLFERNENEPIREDLDKEDYFIAVYRCPNCGEVIGRYSFGRARHEGNKEYFLNNIALQKCKYCNYDIDWSTC